MSTLDTNISGVTETWWAVLHLNCCKANIKLEGGWSAQLQRYGDYFIAKLPTRANITMHPSQWKLFREMFIHLNITTLGDIVTACGKFITKEAYNENKSYDSVHKWPQQQHSILLAHRELWSQCRCGITQQRSRRLLQPLGAWTTAPTTVQPYRMASDKLLVQQQDGSWIQHDQCIHQLPLRSPGAHFEELGDDTSSSPERIQ